MTKTRQRQRRATWLLNALLGNPNASPMEIISAVTAVIRADLEAESGLSETEIARSWQFDNLLTRLQNAFISSRSDRWR